MESTSGGQASSSALVFRYENQSPIPGSLISPLLASALTGNRKRRPCTLRTIRHNNKKKSDKLALRTLASSPGKGHHSSGGRPQTLRNGKTRRWKDENQEANETKRKLLSAQQKKQKRGPVSQRTGCTRTAPSHSALLSLQRETRRTRVPSPHHK